MAHGADAEAQIENEFKGNTDGGSEIRYRRKDNSEFWPALFITPVRHEKGDVVQHFAPLVELNQAQGGRSSVQDAYRRAEPSREEHPFDCAIDRLVDFASRFRP